MVYQNGLLFDGELDENLKELVDRVKKGKASLIIIQGGVGEGKTTLLVEVLDYINSLFDLPEIDLIQPDQLAMGGVEFLKKLRKCFEKKLPCVGYDEAGDFSKRGSLTQFNAMLNRTFETFRAFRCVVVMALPNFDVLDQNLFDSKIPRLMIDLRDRKETYGNYRAYSLYRMALLKSFMKKLKMKNYAYSLVRSNFRGHFKDVSPERSKQLDRLCTRSKLSILRKSEVKIEGLLTYPELATKLMKSVSWVRFSVNNLKIKHNRTIGQVKYFDQHALNLLSEHLDYVSENPKPRVPWSKVKAEKLKQLSEGENGNKY